MKAQGVFNKAVRHFANQMAPCKQGDSCMYRGFGKTEGMTCVIGSFIPDDLYDDDMEENAFEYVMQQTLGSKLKAFFEEKYEGLFVRDESGGMLATALQNVHDMCGTKKNGEFNLTKLRKELRIVARDFGLKTDFLDRTL